LLRCRFLWTGSRVQLTRQPACLPVSRPAAGMLDLVAAALAEADIPFVVLQGSTPARERAKRIRAFASRAPNSPR
jgi:hypothetical protein